MRVLSILAILFLACEASATAAPAYAPSDLSLSDVLKKHDLAVGVGTVDAPGRSEEWTRNSSGMTGDRARRLPRKRVPRKRTAVNERALADPSAPESQKITGL